MNLGWGGTFLGRSPECSTGKCLLWWKHMKPKTGNPRYSKEVIKTGQQEVLSKRGGPGLKSGLDSLNLSGLGKALEGH